MKNGKDAEVTQAMAAIHRAVLALVLVFANLLPEQALAQDQTPCVQSPSLPPCTFFEYDANGNRTKTTDPLAHITTYTYDGLNRLTNTALPGSSGSVAHAYDGADRIKTVTDPLQHPTGYAYDGLGNLNSQVSPDTGTTQYTQYDAAGNLLSKKDAKNQLTTYQYDALNRPTLVTYNDGSKVTYTYDLGTNGLGRLALIQEFNAGNTLVSSLQYGYDPQGRILSETRTLNGVAYTTGYGYTNGRLTSLTYPSGHRLDYTLDAMGRISQVQLTDHGVTKTLASAIQYQPFGGLKSFVNGAGQTYTRHFDGNGRNDGYTLANQSYTLGYDLASNILSQTDAATPPNVSNYGYDALNRLQSATWPGGSLNLIYDANGNRTNQTGSTARSYSISPTGNQLVSATNPAKSYTYDLNGSLKNDGSTAFIYDVRGRLIQAGATTQYLINALGQRIRKTDATRDVIFHYDQAGRLIGESTPQGQFTSTIVYLNDMPLAILQ